MEVMKNAVIKTRTLKPLPGEITNEAINGATLPVKIESARRAIAECTDLSELLRYKSQAEGLAAAVRTMKEVGPELIRAANEMMADAWRKGGELLSAYSNVARIEKGLPKSSGSRPSPRGELARSLGLSATESAAMVRIASAPVQHAYKAVGKTRNLKLAAKTLPSLDARPHVNANKQSAALRTVMGTSIAGLNASAGALRRLDLAVFTQLTPDERKVVKKKIVEIQELLDEMDLLCR